MEKAVVVLVGEWECSGTGSWDFVLHKRCMAQCIIVEDGITYADLKKLIQGEFARDIEGVVARIAYYLPSEMSVFASGISPPVSITTDIGVKTFNQVRQGTRGLNLFVTFEAPDLNEAYGQTKPVGSSGGQIIRLDERTYEFENADVFGEAENITTDVRVENPRPCGILDNERGDKTDPINVDNLYDEEMLAEVQRVEEMVSEAAESKRLRTGKEKHHFNTNWRTWEECSEDVSADTTGDDEDDNNDLWETLISREYHAVQGDERPDPEATFNGITMGSVPESQAEGDDYNRINKGKQRITEGRTKTIEVGEASERGIMMQVTDKHMAGTAVGDMGGEREHNFETGEASQPLRRELFPTVQMGGHGGVEEDMVSEDINVNGNGCSSEEGDDDAIQLSLANIYNEILESDILPSEDVAPCFGDELVETQDLRYGEYDPRNDAIYIGRVFRNKQDMRTALGVYAVKRFFNFMQLKSDKERLIVCCVDRKCPWRVYGHVVRGSYENIEVRTATLTHTCDVSTRSGYGKKASCQVIAEVLRSKFANGKVGPRAVEVPGIVLEELRVAVTYMQGWHAKERAVAEVRGGAEESFKLLLAYLHRLQQTNVGTVAVVEKAGGGTSQIKFKYLFFAISACITAIPCMRKVIIIDATQIKAKFKGCLLTASFQDGNFQIFPIAFGVVNSENDPSWTWFFTQLSAIIPDAEDLVIVSDRHASIYCGIRAMYPRALHGSCAVHLYRNVKAKFRRAGVAYLVSQAASAYTVGQFTTLFAEIERRSPSCAAYLRRIGISHWSRAHFEGKRYNIISSNPAESLNAALAKALEFPIITMVESIRLMLMRWFYERRGESNRHRGPITKEVEEILMKNLEESTGLLVAPASNSIYQVSTSVGVAFTVSLDERTCTCKRFETLGFPCCHALAAARHGGRQIITLVDDYYKTECWRQAYSGIVMPVPDAADAEVPEELRNAELFPPSTSQGVGRPRKRRIPSIGENVCSLTIWWY